jgi:hypothetical protein
VIQGIGTDGRPHVLATASITDGKSAGLGMHRSPSLRETCSESKNAVTQTTGTFARAMSWS